MMRYVAAFLIGGWVGVLVMCLLSVSKEADERAKLKIGEWIETKYGPMCSCCNCLLPLDGDREECPWCGAKMKE